MSPFHLAFKVKDIESTLSVDQFKDVQERLENAEIDFVIKPQKRYKGKVGEQFTMFVFDFSGNPIEFKAFVNEGEVFLV